MAKFKKWQKPKVTILMRGDNLSTTAVLTFCKATPNMGPGGPTAGNPGCVSYDVSSGGCIACSSHESS